MARDTQRSKVYSAERDAEMGRSKAGERLLYGGRRVTSTGNVSIEACQEYVDYITNSAWFQRRWGKRSMTVKHKVYGSATASYGSVICLPPWAREEWSILHEMAHCVTPNHVNGKSTAPHGREFTAAYLTLVRQQMGRGAYDGLRAAFRAHRVRAAALVKPDPALADLVVARSEIEAKAARVKREAARREREQQAAARARRERQLTGLAGRDNARETIRLLVKAGHFGPVGSAGRNAALATARALRK